MYFYKANYCPLETMTFTRRDTEEISGLGAAETDGGKLLGYDGLGNG